MPIPEESLHSDQEEAWPIYWLFFCSDRFHFQKRQSIVSVTSSHIHNWPYVFNIMHTERSLSNFRMRSLWNLRIILHQRLRSMQASCRTAETGTEVLQASWLQQSQSLPASPVAGKLLELFTQLSCSWLPGSMSNHSCMDIKVAETLTKLFEHLLPAPSLHILLCPETLPTRTPVCPVVCEPKNE